MNFPNLNWHRGAGQKSDQVKSPGLPPGTLIHVGEKRADEVKISITAYDEKSVETLKTDQLEDCARFADTGKVVWIHMTGLHDVETVSRLGEQFGINPLVLEDILNTGSRPKVEDFSDSVFVISKLLTCDVSSDAIDSQQFSLILLPNETVLTFLEAPSSIFDPVVQRIETGGGGRIRKRGGDYLVWALLDTQIDHYMQVIGRMDEHLTVLDEKLQESSEKVEAGDLYNAKRDVTALYRRIRPIREITNVLYRADSELIKESTQPYLRDLHDHAIQALETSEDLRETSASLRDFYLSAVSNRMNEIMKVLTCFATIFMPMTFLAGIYGMNFEHMPELKWPWAYPVLWSAFVLTAASMFWYFRRKKWL